MARTMFSDPGLRDTFSATPTWIPTMQREVGLQQFLQQRTQPRPQGALVFQYDGDKVPHFGKLEDLKGRGWWKPSIAKITGTKFFTDRSHRSEHMKSSFSVFHKRIQPRESLTEVRKRWGSGTSFFLLVPTCAWEGRLATIWFAARQAFFALLCCPFYRSFRSWNTNKEHTKKGPVRYAG